MGIEKQLIEMKAKIEGIEDKFHRLEGQLQLLQDQLMKDWSVRSLHEAECLVNIMTEELEDLSQTISEKYQAIVKKFKLNEDQ